MPSDMDSEALGAKVTESEKAVPEDQLKKVNQKEAQSESLLSSTTISPVSPSPSPSQPASPAQPAPGPSHDRYNFPTQKVIMADRGTSMAMTLVILAVIMVIVGALAQMGLSWKGLLACGAVFCVAVILRIFYVGRGLKLRLPRRFTNGGTRTTATNSANLLDRVPAAYFLYVCGSGGHTTEMFELVRLTLNPAPNVHRRYVFTTGDNNSRTAIFDFETRVREHFGETNGGTWDAYQVKRVRNVHQSLLSTPITAWLSLISIYEALTTPPKDRNTPLQRELYRFPHVITTNGPGNGVIVAIMARLLKIFFVAPTNCMRVVFIETWAHVETLSLTGKIFHWGRYVGGIADIFLVQHRELAEKYGYKVFDFITPRH